MSYLSGETFCLQSCLPRFPSSDLFPASKSPMCDSDEIHSDEFIFGAWSGGAEEGRRKDGVLGRLSVVGLFLC